MLLAGNSSDAAGVEKAKGTATTATAQIDEAMTALRPLVETEEGRQALAEVDKGVENWKGFFDNFLTLTAAGSFAEAGDLYNGESKQRASTRTALAKLAALQDAMLKADLANASTSFSTVRLTSIVMLVFSVAVGVAVVWAVRGINQASRTTAVDLRDGAQQVAAASTQVAGSAQSLSRGASEQAASLEETSASMEEMASMTRRNAENSESAAS